MNRFAIEVTAIDKASAVFRKLNTNLAHSFLPVTRLQKQMGALGREMHLGKMTAGMRNLSAASAKVAQSMGLSTAPLEALFGLGAAGGIVAAGAAVVALGAKWGSTGFEISRTATAIGVSTEGLQEFRGVAKLAGIGTDKATAALSNLATTMQDADFGRNAPAYQLMNQFGVAIKRTKDGTVDVQAAMRQWADVLSNVTNPQVRALIANTLGIGDILPLLLQGSTGFDKLAQEARKAGYVLGPQQIQDAQEYGKALALLTVQVDALTNSMGAKVTPWLNTLMGRLQTLQDSYSKAGGGFWSQVGTRAGSVLSGSATRALTFGSDDRSAQRSSGLVTGGPRAPGANSFRDPKYDALDAQNEAAYGLPHGLLSGIRLNGERSNADQVSSAGARSVYQITPSTRDLALKKWGKDAYASDEDASAVSGLLLKDSLARNRGDSEAAVREYIGGTNPANWGSTTNAYVGRVMGGMQGNGAPADTSHTVKVEVAIAGAPPGTQAKASSSNGMPVNAKVSYALPLSGV